MSDSVANPADVPETRQGSDDTPAEVVSSSKTEDDTLVSLVPEGVEVLVKD